MSLTGFLRRWSGMVLAAMLSLSVLAPTIDTFVCMDDAGGQSPMTQSQDHALVSQNQPVQQHDDGDSSCIHGHCHHWVGFTRIGERIAFSSATKSSDPIVGAVERMPSAPRLELLRPPQA